MKTKHIFVIFLFFLTVNLLSQNKYERMNGIFEGSSAPLSDDMPGAVYYFKFEVWQDIIGANGELSQPNFRIYNGIQGNEPFVLMEQARAINSGDYNPDEVIVLQGGGRQGEPSFRIECRFIRGTSRNEDKYVIDLFDFVGAWDFQPVTINRIK